jgi:hypothetical protein
MNKIIKVTYKDNTIQFIKETLKISEIKSVEVCYEEKYVMEIFSGSLIAPIDNLISDDLEYIIAKAKYELANNHIIKIKRL